MTGLTTQEVQERIKQGKVNEEVSSSTRSVNEIVKSNIFTYFNLIFTVLAVLLIVVGSFKDLSFMLIIFANTGIGIYQEIRSKNTLDNLKFSKMPRSIAIRDGRRQEVDTDRLVLDDVVVLGAGNQIPADARVEDGSVSVNEALITGESDEIEKHPGDELMSGSFVVSGECAARLIAVGKHSYINRLTAEATRQKKNDNQSQMVKSLDRLVMFIGVAIIPIGGILMFQQIAIQGLSFRASVIAMVKTGTITENEMQVAGLKSATKEYSEEALRPYIADLAQSQSRDNITMAALQNYFTDGLGREPFHVCGFSSKYKYCGASYEDGNFVLGAPEFVLGENFSRYSEYIQSVSEQGYRVLAFARSREEPKGQTLTEEVRLLALILLVNPIREGAKPTFEYFAENGVDVKVISGDNPVTVSNVAQEAGIADAQNYVDARTLKSQDDVDRAVGRYTVFGRVTPEQKRMFVKGLQKQGKTVGMTGDGVNDILALRDADISIAMASGSEAASNAAQLVLMDSDFSRMPLVVAEGRRVVNNIIKTATLYLTKNIFSLLLAMFSLISVLQYPLKPSQITLISMFTIGIPSFVLSLEPNRDRIRGSFLGNVFRMATPAGITLFLSVSCLLVFGDVLELKASMISTASSALVALVEFMILARVAKPMNRLHLGMMVVMVAGFFYMIIFHNSLFGISPVNWQCALLLVVFIMATEAVFRYFYKFTAFVENFLGREARQRKRH